MHDVPNGGGNTQLWIDDETLEILKQHHFRCDLDGAAVRSTEGARARRGPLANDVVVGVRRGDRAMALRLSRELVRR